MRDHSAPKKGGDLVRVDAIVLGFAAVDRLHVERVSQDERNPFRRAEIGKPIPSEHALHGDDKISPKWADRRKKRLGGSLDVLGKADLPPSVEDASFVRLREQDW